MSAKKEKRIGRGGLKFSNYELSDKQLKFCEHYVTGSTAVAAARAAGYITSTDASARRVASYVLHRPSVSAYLENRAKEIRRKSNDTVAYAVNKLVTIIDKCSKSAEKEGKVNTRELDVVIRSLDQYNKLFGHYAPEKTVNLTVNSGEMLDLVSRYEKQY